MLKSEYFFQMETLDFNNFGQQIDSLFLRYCNPGILRQICYFDISYNMFAGWPFHVVIVVIPLYLPRYVRNYFPCLTSASFLPLGTVQTPTLL